MIGIPISLRKLERDAWTPTSPPEASVLSCKTSFSFLRCPSYLDRNPDFAEPCGVSNGHPHCNSRIYPGSHCNSRNPCRHPPRQELRPESPALGVEQFRLPSQTGKEPQCAGWNTRASPGRLSQDERNTAVTSIMQNSSVYHKSTRDEAHFPFIGSIAIPCSTSYRTSGLTSFRKLQR